MTAQDDLNAAAPPVSESIILPMIPEPLLCEHGYTAKDERATCACDNCEARRTLLACWDDPAWWAEWEAYMLANPPEDAE